jgi:hypothetical protein
VKGQPDPAYAVILATAHQATGALLMGTAWALAALALRVTATSDRHATTTLAAT